MEANHFEMNKFSGRNEAYRMVLSKLKDFLSEDALGIYYSDRNAALIDLNPKLAGIQMQTTPATTAFDELGECSFLPRLLPNTVSSGRQN